MMKANAIFGIKATASWKGKVYNANTQECYDGVNYTNINACFRAYNSLEESIQDYFNLILGLPRYEKAKNCKSPRECITAIKKGGYATSPTYIETIMNIITSNNLTKYDVEDVENPVYNYFVKGKIYTLQVDLHVRAGVGTSSRIKEYKELTSDGKKHAYKQKYAVLKKGTRVTCLEYYIDDKNIWIRIPSGFIAGFYEGKEYVK